MVSISLRRALTLGTFLLTPFLIGEAQAACCGGGTTAFYPTTAYTAYSPVAYTTYRTGWYPGYWLNRIGSRLFGSPTTYVTAYPTTHATSYAPTYTAAYRPAYSVGYTSSYAAPAATSCPTCPTYTASYAPTTVQRVTMQPACPTGCAPCASYGSGVSQATYQQPTGCPSCVTPAPQPSATPTPTPAPQSTYGTQNQAPSLDPGAQVPERAQETQRPANGAQQQIQPEPEPDTDQTDPYEVDGESATYFQAPKLFDPSDRTARRTVAPVTTAVYEKPVSIRAVSARPVSAQQAEQDAAGWISLAQ